MKRIKKINQIKNVAAVPNNHTYYNYIDLIFFLIFLGILLFKHLSTLLKYYFFLLIYFNFFI